MQPIISTKLSSIKPFLLCLMVWAGLTAQTRTVTAEGFGTTHNAALESAKRDAVEQGVGVLIASETLVKNAQVANDRILSKSNGYVKSFKEEYSEQGSDGLWTVRITADVTDILDEVVQDQLALDLLLDWLDNPRFLILINEQNVDDPTTIFSETEIGKIMGERGFDIVSPAITKALQQRNINLAELENDPLKAGALAAEFGAEYIVIGNARSVAVSNPILGSRFSGQGNISAQIVRADNAQILAQETFHGKATHVDPITAGMYSLRNAAEELSHYLVVESVRKWSLEQSNARTITLRINGVTYRDRKTIVAFLENEINNVENVDLRSFAAGLATLSVDFAGSNETLGMAIDGKQIGTKTMYITGETPNSFDISLE